ncbi:hypothetical protein COOONC_28108, partial [Cooperia oncophora]
ESGAAVLRPPLSSMCDCLRQLWLLTRKNLILTRRSKAWTIFELVLPILLTLPIVILIVRGGTVQLSPGRSFDAVPLEGGADDISRSVGFVASIRTRARENEDSVEALMKKLSKRFSSSVIAVDVVKMKSEDYMLDQLRA